MEPSKHKDFTRKVQIVAAIISATVLIIWLILFAFKVFLLAFAAMLVAIFFRSIARPLSHKTGLSMKFALPASIFGVLAIWVGVYFLLAPKVNEQIDKLTEQVPKAYRELKTNLRSNQTGRFILQQIPDQIVSEKRGEKAQKEDKLAAKQKGEGLGEFVKNFFSSTLGVLGDIYVIFLLSIFFTAAPQPYITGIVKLFPPRRRERLEEVMKAASITLRLWLFGKLLSMLVVAVLSCIGLYLIGVPLYITLALFAGLVSFIPNFGPIIAIIPAFLVGYVQSPVLGFWVIALYIGIQAVESNIITPIIMRKQIEVPLAMTLFSQVLLALLVGGLGLIFATPIFALAMVLVQMLYVEGVLGDKTIDVKGERLMKQED